MGAGGCRMLCIYILYYMIQWIVVNAGAEQTDRQTDGGRECQDMQADMHFLVVSILYMDKTRTADERRRRRGEIALIIILYLYYIVQGRT